MIALTAHQHLGCTEKCKHNSAALLQEGLKANHSRTMHYNCLSLYFVSTYSADPSSNAGVPLTVRVFRNQQSHWPPPCSSCSSLSCRPPTMLLFRGIVTCSPGACIQPPGSPSSPTFLNSSRTPRLESLPQPGSGNAGLRSIAVSTDTSTRVLLQHLITHSKVTASAAPQLIHEHIFIQCMQLTHGSKVHE
jgi:hypothetical protein